MGTMNLWNKGFIQKNKWRYAVTFMAIFFLGLFLCSSTLKADTDSGAPKEDIETLKAKAEQGDVEAQFNLAGCYFTGDGVNTDLSEALKWLRKAAEQGHANAQYNLGVCYLNFAEDAEEAVKWFRKAAEQEFPDAQFNLGVCYENGKGVPEDKAEAAKWYRKAAKQGDAIAQYNLGVLYLKGKGIEQDQTEAEKWIRKAAEADFAQAQYALAKLLSPMNEVGAYTEEGEKWLVRAAENGYPVALYEIANASATQSFLAHDRQTFTREENDASKAQIIGLYTRAAEQGHVESQYLLGMIYFYGSLSVAAIPSYRFSDPSDRNSDTEQALKNGIGMGMGIVSSFEFNEIQKDKEKAIEWYTKAGDGGYFFAQFRLAEIYYNDDKLDEAAKWYRKAADQGNAEAQFILGRCYENGDGVPENITEAANWYRKAAGQGHNQAQMALNRLSK